VTWCYASDLHGHENRYRELAALAAAERCDAVLLGGDLLPRKGRTAGSLEAQIEFAGTRLRDFAVRIRDGAGARLFAIPGNDDWWGAVPALAELEREGLMRLCGNGPVPAAGGMLLRGYSFVPPTPFLLKDFEKRDRSADPPPDGPGLIFATRDGRVEETGEAAFFSGRSSIEDDLAAWTLGDDRGRTVCVMHGPPHGTALDRLADGRPAGSRAVRAFISRERPALSLHGHIHESPEISGAWAERLDGTLAVNPGQTGDRLSAVLFDPSDPEATMTHTLHGPLTGRRSR
jgi:uncharacterized protein